MSDQEYTPQPFTRGQRLYLVAVIIVSILVLDHLSKWAAVMWLKSSPPIVYIGDMFRLQYAQNPGAFLSLFGNLSDAARAWLLIGFNAVVLSGVGYYLLTGRAISRGSAIALSLILSGGVGNLIDRVFRDGLVVDFMNVGVAFGSFSIRSGIFNVADLAIMGGLFMLVGVELFGRKPAAQGE